MDQKSLVRWVSLSKYNVLLKPFYSYFLIWLPPLKKEREMRKQWKSTVLEILSAFESDSYWCSGDKETKFCRLLDTSVKPAPLCYH